MINYPKLILGLIFAVNVLQLLTGKSHPTT